MTIDQAKLDEAFNANGFQWTDTRHVPGTSIVSGGVMLLAADGHCLGLVSVLQCESEAVRCDVERALASASNPAKMRRFMNAARSGEAEANERAEKAEAERDAAIAERDRLRKALEAARVFIDGEAENRQCGEAGSDEDSEYLLEAVNAVKQIDAALKEGKP